MNRFKTIWYFFLSSLHNSADRLARPFMGSIRSPRIGAAISVRATKTKRGVSTGRGSSLSFDTPGQTSNKSYNRLIFSIFAISYILEGRK